MDAPPRPPGSDLNSGGISLALSSTNGLTDFGDLQSSASANETFMRATPLSHWVTSHAGPWDPIFPRNSNVSRGGDLNFRPESASFSAYRSNASPSECETAPPGHLSDSGYGGSLTRQSVVDSSVYGDCDQSGDAASVSNHLAGIHFGSLSESWSQQASVSNEVSVTIAAKRLICPHCKSKVKTRSELKYVS